MSRPRIRDTSWVGENPTRWAVWRSPLKGDPVWCAGAGPVALVPRKFRTHAEAIAYAHQQATKETRP